MQNKKLYFLSIVLLLQKAALSSSQNRLYSNMADVAMVVGTCKGSIYSSYNACIMVVPLSVPLLFLHYHIGVDSWQMHVWLQYFNFCPVTGLIAQAFLRLFFLRMDRTQLKLKEFPLHILVDNQYLECVQLKSISNKLIAKILFIIIFFDVWNLKLNGYFIFSDLCTATYTIKGPDAIFVFLWDSSMLLQKENKQV